MKKIIFLVIAMITFGITTAQTEKGHLFFEVNTNLGAASPSSTGFSFSTEKVGPTTVTQYNVGAEAGYFLMEGLALKLGVGYGDDSVNSVLGFKIGAKYYLQDKFPIQLDLNGSYNKVLFANPMYVGLQVGYAFFIGDNVSIEPAVRYDYSVNDQYSTDGIIQLNLGLVLHL